MEDEINFDLISQELPREFIKKVLVKDFTKRASLETLLNDPWITNKGLERINT